MRFRGNFMNTIMNNHLRQPIVNYASYTTPYSYMPSNQKTGALNYPMIGRIYKAKPGCGSCGK